MIQPSQNLRSTINNDGAAVLNTAKNQITVLDVMGGYIWRQIEAGMDQDEIVDHLAKETGEDLSAIARDIEGFLGELSACSLLELVVTPSRGEEGA